MNSPSQQRGAKVGVMVAILALAGMATVVFLERSKHRTALEVLRRERDGLQTQLEARDLVLSELKAENRNLRALVGVGATAKLRAGSRASAPSPGEMDLRRQITALQASHSNAVALAESLAAERARLAADEERSSTESALAELESSASEALENAEAARQRAEELLVALNIPADVAAMDPDQALQSENLRAYWPYFDARRERDALQRTADALRLRLVQESADAGTETTRSVP